jgi:hypothetical protein
VPMKTALRLTVVMTHPIQYYSPWFRHVAANSKLDLTVIYAVEPSAAQQGVGFGQPFCVGLGIDGGVSIRSGAAGASG